MPDTHAADTAPRGQDNIQIVLVETYQPGNIGAAARAMKTMGLHRLTLVAPRFPVDETAAEFASGAVDILENARVVETLAEALADCRYAYGMTARVRKVGVPQQPLGEAAPEMLRRARAGEVAIVFGRERSGLSNAELDLCQGRVHIRANPDFGSLNLAAAVQVLGYALAEQREAYATPVPSTEAPARHEDLEHYFSHLERVLTELEFLGKTNPALVMRRLRGLYQRALPDEREIQILRGILTETEKRLR
ncbi:RNA methyltransferase [Alkalilimnicola sp. S0819]|uniref:RNA methyltransferase n=1 Tax=Alkalilimnicola sp. S0819 TaxID=2613922 RepID=UPI001262731A|nr:RNA methyltransferase [Alkalilimnicola sp. S0819]KAB7624118.1 RNA methyltransferase [Alkalilimnicola sp. S0819]MPQ16370.1 TrmJ/YjtD family RNA methyltransferase [Alkalilimnicola sp. S0819]